MTRCPSCGLRHARGIERCRRTGCKGAIEAAPPIGVEPPDEPPSIDGYKIARRLAVGGFGSVYEAIGDADGARVAIKTAHVGHPLSEVSLQHEADALTAACGPWTPALIDSGAPGVQPGYLIMEFVDSPTLADRMENGPARITAADLGVVIGGLLDAVDHLHDREIVHGDLKPENIFVGPDGATKVCDFGSSCGPTWDTLVTVDSTDDDDAFLGTPEYMSPEQCDGSNITARSDVYSLGVIVYELLSGAPPFLGTAAELREAHRSRRPAPLPNAAAVPKPLARAIARCLSKDPLARGSVTELRDAIGRAGSAAVQSPAHPTAKEPRPSPRKRSARESVAQLWFSTDQEITSVTRLLGDGRAELGSFAHTRVVAVIPNDASEDPLEGAVRMAEALVSSGMTHRVIVDVGEVSVRVRPNGKRRWTSRRFSEASAFPADADPPGVLLREAAATAIRDAAVHPVPGRPGLFTYGKRSEAAQMTGVRSAQEPLFGRDALMSALEASAKAAADGKPTLVTIRGERGLGKSRLCGAIVDAAREQVGMRVVTMRAVEPVGGAAGETVRDLLRRALRLPPRCGASEGPALLQQAVGDPLYREHQVGLLLAMGWADHDDAAVQAIVQAPGAVRAAVAQAAGEVLRHLAAECPAAVVLDDAHYADDALLDAFEYATLQEAGARIWICVVGGSGFSEGRAAWGSRAAARRTIVLPPLEETAGLQLVRHLLAPAANVPTKVVRRLFERTSGSPLLMVDLVAGLRRDGVLRRSQRGSGWFLATDELEKLPDLPVAEWLASRELGTMEAPLRRHAALAAVMGPEFSPGDLAGVVHQLEDEGIRPVTDLDALVGVRRLVTAGVLVQTGTGRMTFRHAILREAAAAELSAEERQQSHRAAYAYFSALSQQRDRDCLAYEALHAGAAGMKGAAVDAYLALAARAELRHDYVDAELLFGRVVANLDASRAQARIPALHGRAKARFRVGRHEDAIDDFEAARSEVHAAGDRSREIEILLDAATVWDWRYAYQAASDLVDQAGELAGDATSDVIEARLLLGRGRSAARFSRVDEALASLEPAAQRAKLLGADGYETWIIALLLLGVLYSVKTDFERAIATFDEAIALATAHGDQLHLATAYQNRCLVWLMQGQAEQIQADMQQTLAIARRAGFPLLENATIRNLGEVCYLVGDFGQAQQYAQRSVDLARDLGGSAGNKFSCELLLARALLLGGDIERARGIVTGIRAEQARAEGEQDPKFVPSEEILCRMVELALDPGAGEGWEVLVADAARDCVQPQELVEVIEVRAWAARRLGQTPAAEAHLAEAIEMARKNAGLMLPRLDKHLADLRGET